MSHFWTAHRHTFRPARTLLGYPRIPGSEPTLTPKLLNVTYSFEYLEAGKLRLFFADEIQGGFSGSPILDMTGHLTGLLIGRTESVGENNVTGNKLGKAIPVDEITEWLSQ